MSTISSFKDIENKHDVKSTHKKNKKYCKVRDHYYYTGEYRGAAYSICILKYSISQEITIIFHNG